jgi:uncharacterized membrane protein YqjE
MVDLSNKPEVTSDPADRSLVDDLRQLAGDAHTTAAAELAYQQSRAKLVAGSLGGIAGRAALAIAFVFFALMGLVVGAILALTPALTAWGATALVVVVLAIGAALLALWARARWRRLVSLVTGGDPHP